jgi:hypothetical protein
MWFWLKPYQDAIRVVWTHEDAFFSCVRARRAGPGPVEIRIEPDIQILLFTAGVVLLGGLLSGLAPAWIASRTVPASSLRTGGRTGETRSQRSFGNGLVIAQVAVSLLLLSSAAAFVLHRSNLRNNDLG